MDMLRQLSLAGLVPVIQIKQAQDAVPLCRALKNGGLPVAEITFRTDAAEEAIRLVHEALPDVLLGAGTVLTCEQADRAIAAGASYIVSPGLNPETVKHCLKMGYPVLPGCANPSDIEAALALGLRTVKFFPAEALGGVKMLKALSAPYGGLRFVPTGGINEKNLPDYLSLPQVAACGGSWMVPADAVENRDWPRIEALARDAVKTLLGLELMHVGVNEENAENACRDAEKLALLLGWDLNRDSAASVFAGRGFELMKAPGRGRQGHIAIGTIHVDRARWHMEKRGFAFDETTAEYTGDGALRFIYLRDEIGGFAIHLVKK